MVMVNKERIFLRFEGYLGMFYFKIIYYVNIRFENLKNIIVNVFIVINIVFVKFMYFKKINDWN